ncbi:erythromycin resistance leader peptide [Bacillus sp. OxB-1]
MTYSMRLRFPTLNQ